MIESRCGILCSECKYLKNGMCKDFCINIDKPFWGDSCDVKTCCEAKGYEYCGQCPDFPCATLTEMSYADEEGDNGKRIRTCKMWTTGFDANAFIAAVANQDAKVLEEFFAADAIIRWHDSNEQFTVAEYIRANCEYPGCIGEQHQQGAAGPGQWSDEIQRIEKIDGGIVLVTKIFSSDFATLVTAFISIENGKITHLDEYYADYNDEIPQWRKEMNIGKPIQ